MKRNLPITLTSFLTALLLFLILIPYSMFLGWSFFSGVLFWLILVPVVAYVFSMLMVKGLKRALVSAMAGFILFHLFMVFMIYEHYKTDMFILMVGSIIPAAAIILFVHVLAAKRAKVIQS
ncbi:MAG: hypothetical protein AAFX87_05350 [Bacteroidota bacterium]